MNETKANAQDSSKGPARPNFASLNFTIPDTAWSESAASVDSGAEGSRLYASVSINGTGFHCEAIEVHISESGIFEAVDDHWEHSLGLYYEACAADGPMESMTINGREYAVFLTPFCQ